MSTETHQMNTAATVSGDIQPDVGLDLDRAVPEKQRPTVLIVDDDIDVVELLKTGLRREGMDVVGAVDGYAALHKYGETQPDIILLDLMMPNLSGWETFRRMRSVTDTPIMIVSAMATKEQMVEGLENGVDDYVTKPFYMPEVAARVRAVLRRSPSVDQPDTRIFPETELVIEPETHHVSLRGQIVDLSPNEFALLKVLAGRAPRPATYEQIMQAVWHEQEVQRDRIKYLAYLLRQKLEDDPSNPKLILTRTDVGYVLKTSEPYDRN